MGQGKGYSSQAQRSATAQRRRCWEQRRFLEGAALSVVTRAMAPRRGQSAVLYALAPPRVSITGDSGNGPGHQRSGRTRMEIQVDLRIAAQARRCKKQLVCLSGDLESLCKVKDIAPDVLYLVEDTDKQKCGYQVRFGRDAVVCLCPVRREIYKRYGM
jgi:hypothetical protein